MRLLYTASLITADDVIPAKAGIQENTGFRVKPGMTNCTRFMSSCIISDGMEKIEYFTKGKQEIF